MGTALVALWTLLSTVSRVLQRLCFRVDVPAFSFEIDEGAARGGSLLFEIRAFELFDGLHCQLVEVVKEVLAETVPFEEAEASVRTSFAELQL